MRHPLERIVRLLACKLAGHQYTVAREFGSARKVTCSRCRAAWAMHDDSRSFLPWDSEFEAMYAPGGMLATEGPDSNRGASKGEVATHREPAQAMAHRSSADSVTVQLQPNK